jgi:hypothetical protein
LIGGGFDLLEAHDIGTLVRDPGVDLRVACADAVDVPGGYLQTTIFRGERWAHGLGESGNTPVHFP